VIDRAGLDKAKSPVDRARLEGADDGELFLEYKQAEVLPSTTAGSSRRL